MPILSPTLSWTHIRNYCEKFRWRDPKTNLLTEGYNPPKHIPQKNIEKVPFSIKFITSKGRVEVGWCICLKVYRRKHQRLLMFVESGEKRIARDYLIMEVNGTRFVTRSINSL